MPKFGDLISLGTATKFAGGIMAGGAATVGVQYYMGSSEFSKDPQITEIREDQKKVSFEIQQSTLVGIRRIFESISIYIIETEQRSASVAFVRENLCQIAIKTQSEAAGILKTKPDRTAFYCHPCFHGDKTRHVV